mmetsp:Transcript_49176/g.115822  ORF Transcript_49176/g.115822 Transcript_49176/m.115822 type:complete len:340 (-) Transcript_49176:346-1365(-)
MRCGASTASGDFLVEHPPLVFTDPAIQPRHRVVPKLSRSVKEVRHKQVRHIDVQFEPRPLLLLPGNPSLSVQQPPVLAVLRPLQSPGARLSVLAFGAVGKRQDRVPSKASLGGELHQDPPARLVCRRAVQVSASTPGAIFRFPVAVRCKRGQVNTIIRLRSDRGVGQVDRHPLWPSLVKQHQLSDAPVLPRAALRHPQSHLRDARRRRRQHHEVHVRGCVRLDLLLLNHAHLAIAAAIRLPRAAPPPTRSVQHARLELPRVHAGAPHPSVECVSATESLGSHDHLADLRDACERERFVPLQRIHVRTHKQALDSDPHLAVRELGRQAILGRARQQLRSV